MRALGKLGPSATWEEDSDSVYGLSLQSAASTLASRLKARVAALEDAPDLDTVVLEARRQIAASAVDGHLTSASDLECLILDLLLAREANRGFL